MDAVTQTLAEVLDELRQSPQSDRGVTHFTDSGEVFVSYSDLWRRAHTVLGALQSAGATAGSQVIISTPSNPQFLDAFWACQLGGMTAVPVTPGQSQAHKTKLFNVFAELPDAWVFSTRATLEPIEVFARSAGLSEMFASLMNRVISADAIPANQADGTPCESLVDDVALIQFSSGSTGSPKGVQLTHNNLITNVKGIDEWGDIDQSDSWFCWAPLYHDMGLIACHIGPIVTGINQYHLPTERFARRPLLWLTYASEKKATILASPNFGYRHYLKAMRAKSAQDKLAELDLSAVRIIYNAAEPISDELCIEFENALAPYGLRSKVISPVYGLAEASVCVSFPKGGGYVTSRRVDQQSLGIGDQIREGDGPSIVGCGTPIPGNEVRIVDDGGQTLPSNTVGHIQIRGGNVSIGYFGQERRAPDEWLDTGDLGVLDDQIYIVGRSKETLILNGLTYHPQDLEEICAEIEEIGHEKVICTSAMDESGTERLLVFVVYRGDLKGFRPLIRQIKRKLAEGALLEPQHVLPLRSLPRTTSGKLQRFALRDEFSAGDFHDVVAELEQLDGDSAGGVEPNSEIERMLLDICRKHITTENVFVDDNILEMGTSSLALVEICEEVDESFPGVLDLDDFLDHNSISSLASFIESKLS